MTQFDLSILEKLKTKFESLEQNIQKLNDLIKQEEKSILSIDNQISSLESSKMDIQIKIGNLNKDLIAQQEIYTKTNSQYNDLKDSANKLISLLNE